MRGDSDDFGPILVAGMVTGLEVEDRVGMRRLVRSALHLGVWPVLCAPWRSQKGSLYVTVLRYAVRCVLPLLDAAVRVGRHPAPRRPDLSRDRFQVEGNRCVKDQRKVEQHRRRWFSDDGCTRALDVEMPGARKTGEV